MDVTQLADDMLTALTGAMVTDVYNLVQSETMDPQEWPLAQRIEQPDCCALCRDRDRKVIRVADADFLKYRRQFHMNCRGYWAYIHRDQGHEEMGRDGRAVWVGTRPDWHDQPVPQHLIDRYGHFVAEPRKYAALNVPARPGGREFIFYPGPPGEPGRIVFAPMLPDGILRQTVARIASLTLQSTRGPVVSRAATLLQCARQIADRAPANPEVFIRDLAHSRAEYGGALSDAEFARQPTSVLDHDEIAVAAARVSALTGSHPAVVFRAGSGAAASATVLDARTGQLAYVMAPPPLLALLPHFQPLTGSW